MRFFFYGLLTLSILFSGCTSHTQLLRPAPKEGVSVNGINILFLILPLDQVTRSGSNIPETTTKATAKDLTAPREQTERLKNELQERLIPKLHEKGINTNYSSYTMIPGITPITMDKLFPNNADNMHLLVITPIAERTFCGPTCSTQFIISLSLRTPKDNRELWNLRIEQPITAGANWIPTRNYGFIDDIANSILEVISSTKK